MALVKARRTQDVDPEEPPPVVPASLIDPLRAVPVIDSLLRVRASFVALRREDTGLQLLASSGLSEEEATRLLDDNGEEIGGMLDGDTQSISMLPPDTLSRERRDAGQRLTLVPIAR